MFDIDMQVVCIKDNWAKRSAQNENRPVKDQVLTIRDIQTFDHTLELGLLFYEVVNSPRMYSGLNKPMECTFPGSCFRPVKKTNIEQFKKIAAKPPKTTVDQDNLENV